MPTVKLGTKAVGSTIKLNLNGSPREFLIMHQGNPSTGMYDASCNGTWVRMKEAYENRQWDSSNNDYANSDVDAWLNGTFLNMLDQDIREQGVKQVKIPYRPGSGNGSNVNTGAVTSLLILADESDLTDVPYLRGLSISNASAQVSYLPNGTYRVYLATKSVDETDWQPVRSKETVNNSYILVKNGGSVTLRVENDSNWTTAIGNLPTVDKKEDNRIFSLDGRYLGTDADKLGRGMSNNRQIGIRTLSNFVFQLNLQLVLIVLIFVFHGIILFKYKYTIQK